MLTCSLRIGYSASTHGPFAEIATSPVFLLPSFLSFFLFLLLLLHLRRLPPRVPLHRVFKLVKSVPPTRRDTIDCKDGSLK